jgi:hypothetical protein
MIDAGETMSVAGKRRTEYRMRRAALGTCLPGSGALALEGKLR